MEGKGSEDNESIGKREESKNVTGEGNEHCENVRKREESKDEEGEGSEYSGKVCNRKNVHKNVEDGKDVEEVGSEKSEWESENVGEIGS